MFHSDERVQNRRVICGTLPVDLNYKSVSGCKYGDNCHFRRIEADGQPNEESKKSGGKGSVALLKETVQLG